MRKLGGGTDTRKPETQIREARRMALEAQQRATEHANSRRAAESELLRVRGKLTQAEQQAAEWRQRFDTLLARVPIAPIRPDDFESANPLCDAPLCMRDAGHHGPHVMYSVRQLNADGTAVLAVPGRPGAERTDNSRVPLCPAVVVSNTPTEEFHHYCMLRTGHEGPHEYDMDGSALPPAPIAHRPV